MRLLHTKQFPYVFQTIIINLIMRHSGFILQIHTLNLIRKCETKTNAMRYALKRTVKICPSLTV